jgi:hypothetical protein
MPVGLITVEPGSTLLSDVGRVRKKAVGLTTVILHTPITGALPRLPYMKRSMFRKAKTLRKEEEPAGCRYR